jgi:hypothetical protein
MDEINPVAIVREFLSDNGMKVSPIHRPTVISYYNKTNYFYVTVGSGDLVEVATNGGSEVRLSCAVAYKIPVKIRGHVRHMDRDDAYYFNLVEPDSLEEIHDFLNP